MLNLKFTVHACVVVPQACVYAAFYILRTCGVNTLEIK